MHWYTCRYKIIKNLIIWQIWKWSNILLHRYLQIGNIISNSHSTVEPLTNDHPHQRPSLSYEHISCDGQGILCVYESLTSDHPSYTTTPMWFWGWSYKRGSTVQHKKLLDENTPINKHLLDYNYLFVQMNVFTILVDDHWISLDYIYKIMKPSSAV